MKFLRCQIFLLMLGTTTNVFAQDSLKTVASLLSSHGQVELSPNLTDDWKPVHVYQSIVPGQAVVHFR